MAMNQSDKKALYNQKKEKLLSELKCGGSFSLSKKTSNLFRKKGSDQTKKLDVKSFNQVISIDPQSLTAEIEAMITYEELVKETLQYDLLPPVVPELKTITVGGALVGLGIESSSFKYGLVHETILEVEVLTGDGKILICTPENEHRDLFFALPNSYGTLGVALKIKLSLNPAKKTIRLTNLSFSDPTIFFDAMKELCLKKRLEKQDAFIDGVIFNNKEMYIILGEFVEEKHPLSNYTYMSPYFQAIQKKKIHYLSTYDYIWRWDSDWFWCSKHFGMHNPILRFLFGKFTLQSSFYWKMNRLFASNPLLKALSKLLSKPSETVIQDILIPTQNAPQFYEFFEKAIGITPIWICPFHSRSEKKIHPLFPLDPKPLYIDFGFWDIVQSTETKGFLNRKIEQKTKELAGYKSLYSESFYTEEEFWAIHAKETFSKLKGKYDPNGSFKGLYEKCVRS